LACGELIPSPYQLVRECRQSGDVIVDVEGTPDDPGPIRCAQDRLFGRPVRPIEITLEEGVPPWIFSRASQTS
jgi:hypothetical protein